MKILCFYNTILLMMFLMMFSTLAIAQELLIKPSRTISFLTDEGTYMNIDVSPDGKTLVFDLLGDLYTLPVTGGEATQITRGLAFNSFPVWSPDGKFIAYFSDATGSTHLHVRDLSGNYQQSFGQTDKQLGSFDPFNAHHAPVWLPGGKEIVTGIWDYRSPGEIRDGAIFSLTGDKLICDPASDSIGTPIALLNDHHSRIYFSKGTLYCYNSATYETKKIATPPEKARSISISPDGKVLAYILDSDTCRSLILEDLAINKKKILITQMIREPIELKTWIAPRHFSFSPDSRFIYICFLGKIHQIEVNSGEEKIIPFTANVEVDLGPLNYNDYRVNQDSFSVKYMRSAQASPDGKQLAFAAMGKIYIMNLPDGKPRILTDQPFNQFQPAWSPDGQWIAYVSWSDTEGGFVWKVPAGGGKPEKIGKKSGHYYATVWSPDASLIATVMKDPVLGNRGVLGKGKIQLISPHIGSTLEVKEEVLINNMLSFSPDGQELIYKPIFVAKESSGPMLVARNLNTNSIRTLLTGVDGGWFEPLNIESRSISPDGKYITYSASENLYLVPYIPSPSPQVIYKINTLVSAIRFANGVDPHWEEGGKYLSWTYGNRYYRINPDKIIAAAQQSPGMASAKYTPSVNVTPDLVVDMPVTAYSLYGKGTLVLNNARILTMKGDEVLERGAIVIQDGRILEVGPKGNIAIPATAKVIDLHGATIMPGLIDLHLHMYVPNGVMAQQNWMFLASLAYGVTTASDPSQIYGSFGYGEMLRAGQMTGPRLYGAGQAIREDAISFLNNSEQARQLAEKRAIVGGILMKQYSLPTRLERQRLLLACQSTGINMTNEGGFDPTVHIGMIKDGSTGIEHATYLGNNYKDHILLRAKSGTYWDPTLQCYQAQDYLNWKYWKMATPKMKRFLPVSAIEEITNAKPADSLAPVFLAPARIAAQVRHAGGRVVLGSHGNNKGVGPHNELWALQAGGLTNMEALQAATILGAEALGLQQDIGSLEKGKIADLIILNSNPLEDIHNSRDIRYVMKDGILYDGETLSTLWPFKKKLPEWKLKVPASSPKQEKAIALGDHQH